MPRRKTVAGQEPPKRPRPALTIEARENQLIALAVDLAEKQLLEGTASSQVITHYLKLGTTRERLEKEIMEKQKQLLEAKTDAIQSEKASGELYSKVLAAMRLYSGYHEEENDPDIY